MYVAWASFNGPNQIWWYDDNKYFQKEQFEKKTEKKSQGESSGTSNAHKRRGTLTVPPNKEHQYLRTPVQPGQPADKVTLIYEKFDVDKVFDFPSSNSVVLVGV